MGWWERREGWDGGREERGEGSERWNGGREERGGMVGEKRGVEWWERREGWNGGRDGRRGGMVGGGMVGGREGEREVNLTQYTYTIMIVESDLSNCLGNSVGIYNKQGQTNKQGKATQHTQGSHFS